MFNIAFGDRRLILSTARMLRKVHSRVTGHFPNDTRGGALPRGQAYTAAHTHALLWVGLALAESVMLGHAMLIGAWSSDELDSLARDAALGMLLFGIPRKLATGTYDDFRVAMEACWTSPLIGASDEAKHVLSHLLYPKKLHLVPVFAVARWVTFAILPPRMAAEFMGREPLFAEKLGASVLLGALRFLNRLTPGPLRYVPEYSAAMRRIGESTCPAWCRACDPCARVLERVTRFNKDWVMNALLPKPQLDPALVGRQPPTPFASGDGDGGAGVTGWRGPLESAGPASGEKPW